MINLAQMDIINRRKGFANASDYLETWDDSDSIMDVNARKELRHATTIVAEPLRGTTSRF